MIIPLIDRADFANCKRDRLLNYENYLARAENLIKRIPNAASKLSDIGWLQDSDPGRLLRLTHARCEYALDLLTISYSAGVSVETLRSAFPEVITFFEEYALYSEKYNETPDGRLSSGPHIAIRDVEFVVANRLVCFAVLLGWVKLLPRIMPIIEYNNDEMDGMLERIVATCIPRFNEIPCGCARHLPYFKTLAIFQADASARSELMREYLDSWYRASRGEPYYDSHERGKRYLGYWSWEAGAISLVLDINDHSYRDHEFYPRDMVEFGKGLNCFTGNVAADNAPPELRVKAGEPAIADGTWESIGIPAQRVNYSKGEKLRDLGSPYGLTVWRYVYDQLGSLGQQLSG